MSMTESEKVKKWFDSELSMRPEESLDSVECEEVKEICLNTIEEREQYRAIGTVERFKYLSKSEHNYENCHNLTCRTRCEKDGYVKGIDDFAEAVKAKILPMLHTEEEYAVAEKALDDIANELKERRV